MGDIGGGAAGAAGLLDTAVFVVYACGVDE